MSNLAINSASPRARGLAAGASAGGTKQPNPTDKHVGARVRMRRMMLGMSQEKLGDGLGVTFQQVQKYEKGANRIGASRLQQIARILQVPESFFFEGAPNGHAVPNRAPRADLPTAFFQLPGASELAEHYIDIPGNVERRVVIAVACGLAKKAKR